MAGTRTRSLSPLLQAVALDNSLPISPIAAALWLRDVENPLRWGVRPLLQFALAAVAAHGVVLEASAAAAVPRACAAAADDLLVLQGVRESGSKSTHPAPFATESNILNFLRDNARLLPAAPGVRHRTVSANDR